MQSLGSITHDASLPIVEPASVCFRSAAAGPGNAPIAEALVEAWASVSLRDMDGRNALDRAANTVVKGERAQASPLSLLVLVPVPAALHVRVASFSLHSSALMLVFSALLLFFFSALLLVSSALRSLTKLMRSQRFCGQPAQS